MSVRVRIDGIGTTRDNVELPTREAHFVAAYLQVGDSITFHSQYLAVLGEITWTRLEDS